MKNKIFTYIENLNIEFVLSKFFDIELGASYTKLVHTEILYHPRIHIEFNQIKEEINNLIHEK